MGPFSTHRFLMRAALSAAHIFAWLFVFQYFFVVSGDMVYSLVSLALSYATAQIVAILLTPLTARRVRHGIRGMLVNALLSLSAAFAILAASFSGFLGSVPLGIVCFAVCMGLYRALYWIPYELASKKYPSTRVLEIVLALIPAVSGYVMTLSSSAPLLVLSIASFVSLIAIIPVYAIKNTQEGFSWHYRNTFRHLFTRTHRQPLLQALCNGFEGAALLVLWPAAVLVLLNWSYVALGLVLSATAMCTLAARLFIKPLDARMQSPIVLSALTFSGWILRGTVAAPFSIVLVDTYYRSGSGISQRGVDLITSEQTADSNSYIDEFTALKDMGQGIGRVLFCLLLFVLSPLFSFAVLALVLFAAAAIVAVLSIMISHTISKHAF